MQDNSLSREQNKDHHKTQNPKTIFLQMHIKDILTDVFLEEEKLFQI